MNDDQIVRSPFVIVIFGATGDLTKRKLMPALFHLYSKNVLPAKFFIVGFSRRDLSDETFEQYMKQAVKKAHKEHKFEEKTWDKFCKHLYYQRGSFSEIQGYNELIERLAAFDDSLKACVPRYFYFSTPPDQYSIILDYLKSTKLSEGCGQDSDKWTKVMIEKPFGRNLEDAQALDIKLSKTFGEEQIYRIDHYLGKETVQNILAFRFGNSIFDPIWNRQFIDHVQVTISETMGIKTRGNFYEGVGALRDMAQSHLLQLLTAVTMNQPRKMDDVSIRKERARTIEKIDLIRPNKVDRLTVRGQYGKKRTVKSYRDEDKVANNSNTETFVALKLTIDDARWVGVPFYLRTGKMLKEKLTQISVVFKEPRIRMFGKHPVEAKANVLTFCLQPNEGIVLALNAKRLGLKTSFEEVPMSFSYAEHAHPEEKITEAYEKLLLEALRGDQTLFTRTDEVESSWNIISNIAKGWWRQGTPRFPNYSPGSWGPVDADKLIARDGREWMVR